LFRVADIHTVRIYVRVPQQLSAGIKAELTAEVKLPQYPNKTFKATVATTSSAINNAARTLLVPRHGDFDWLGQSNSGRCLGSTSSSMLRGVLGCLLMKLARSRVNTIWCTEGGLTRKYYCMSVSAGGLRCRRV
jgi:Barrel-sandwich domain of CusB or HlyD membrane-fusion